MFEFSSQSSALLYPDYAIDRHDTHLYQKKITRTRRSNTGTARDEHNEAETLHFLKGKRRFKMSRSVAGLPRKDPTKAFRSFASFAAKAFST